LPPRSSRPAHTQKQGIVAPNFIVQFFFSKKSAKALPIN
jgi:hypothetical protein